jgi:pimeloyl-ACP methyl ester carboxylesterase
MVAAYASEHPNRIARLVQLGPVPRQFGTSYPADEAAGDESLGDEARRAQREWEEAERSATPSSDQHALCLIQQRAMFLWSLGDPSKLGHVRDVCRYENERPAALARHFGSHFADIQKRQFSAEPFRAVTAPVLTIHGRLDRNAAYGAGREWARTFPNARLITLPNAAHQSWIDDPTVIEDVDAFLAGKWPERAEILQ